MRLLGRPRDIAITFDIPTRTEQRLGEVSEAAMATLEQAASAFGEVPSARWWITYGTLLGLVREGRLLPHDNDIDIAVLEGADFGQLKAALQARGFILHRVEEGPRGPTKAKFSRSQVMLDIFFVRQDAPLWTDHCLLLRRSLVRSTHPPVEIVTRRLAGLDLPVPADTETYLSHLYGPDWRQPVAVYHWYFSASNAELHVHWFELAGVAERWLRWQRKRARA